jgi:putative hemolysin
LSTTRNTPRLTGEAGTRFSRPKATSLNFPPRLSLPITAVTRKVQAETGMQSLRARYCASKRGQADMGRRGDVDGLFVRIRGNNARPRARCGDRQSGHLRR